MLAGMGYILGYDGHFEFDNIGDDYIKNDVPYVGLRALPATLGALLVPLTYMIMTESGYPIITATLAAIIGYPDSVIIIYVNGTRSAPKVAGNALRPT